MEVVRLSAGYLRAHGSPTARLDAELLAALALGIRRLDIYLQYDRPLDEPQLAAIRELVRRRGGGEPVAYITGEKDFWGRPFTVTPAVLIPRPETETLVQVALDHARTLGRDHLTIVDVATGSGCVAVTLAAELPGARLVATDVSAGAAAVARVNAERHGVADRVDVLVGSWADPVDGVVADILVANPPYIATAVLESLDRDVRDHEPRLALDGGEDGLDAYRALLPSAARVLAADGWAAFETDIGAAREVELLGVAALGGSPRTHPDLSGRPRVVTVDRGRAGAAG